MLKVCKNNNEKILEAIKSGNIDAGNVAFPNFIDDIILKMHKMGLTELFSQVFKDKRSEKNNQIPLGLLFILVIAAKMKIKTSLTDIPFAITSPGTLSELGWNLYDSRRDLENGLISDGMIRGFLGNHEDEQEYINEFIKFYNNYAGAIKKTLDIRPFIHILDCTKIEVNLKNENYEKSDVIKDDDSITRRGYKLATLRGLMDYAGIIEEISIDSIRPHDLTVSVDMIKKSNSLQPGDILINDRGFLSRDLVNYLKAQRGVDVYVPAKRNMDIYEEAVSIAKRSGKWQKHPNSKRDSQKIAFVEGLGSMWRSDNLDIDVQLNACVVYDSNAKKEENEYFVFLTTDLGVTARQIIKTYELRPEIEEDFRQVKDFWKLEDFKSTKYVHITFHIVMTLIGYMYFQIYKNTEEGKEYVRKSLPVILKNYVSKKERAVVIYAGEYFGIFNILEFMDIYASIKPSVRKLLKPVLKLL